MNNHLTLKIFPLGEMPNCPRSQTLFGNVTLSEVLLRSEAKLHGLWRFPNKIWEAGKQIAM